MVSLVLVRHAKSDWGSPELSDHDRPLNERGLRDAPRMAARLASTGFRPDVVLASTALRARTTAGFFADEFGVDAQLDDGLYASSPATILERVVAAGVPSVLLVAHNPGIGMLASRLSDGQISMMPTCGVSAFTWDEDDWDVATALPPTTLEFTSPADLR